MENKSKTLLKSTTFLIKSIIRTVKLIRICASTPCVNVFVTFKQQVFDYVDLRQDTIKDRQSWANFRQKGLQGLKIIVERCH